MMRTLSFKNPLLGLANVKCEGGINHVDTRLLLVGYEDFCIVYIYTPYEHLGNGFTFMPVQCTGIIFSFLFFSFFSTPYGIEIKNMVKYAYAIVVKKM